MMVSNQKLIIHLRNYLIEIHQKEMIELKLNIEEKLIADQKALICHS